MKLTLSIAPRDPNFECRRIFDESGQFVGMIGNSDWSYDLQDRVTQYIVDAVNAHGKGTTRWDYEAKLNKIIEELENRALHIQQGSVDYGEIRSILRAHSPEPSGDDIEAAKRIYEAGKHDVFAAAELVARLRKSKISKVADLVAQHEAELAEVRADCQRQISEARVAARRQDGAKRVESLRRIISQQNTERETLIKNMHELVDAADARANEYLARAEKAESEAKDAYQRCLAIAIGCHDYQGGYHDEKESGIYHHGIQTVINGIEALIAHPKGGDTQLNMIEGIGRAALRESVPGTEPGDLERLR